MHAHTKRIGKGKLISQNFIMPKECSLSFYTTHEPFFVNIKILKTFGGQIVDIFFFKKPTTSM